MAQGALTAFDTGHPSITRFATRISPLREIITPLVRRLLAAVGGGDRC